MKELSRRKARLWSEQMQMCTPVDNSWWGQGPQRRVKCVSDPLCSQFWGHSLLGTWHTQCLTEEVWETSAQPQAVHRRMCSGWIIQEPRPWKTAVQMRCVRCWLPGRGSVCSLLSLIMSPLLSDVAWTHLTKVIWNSPVFVCFLLFLFFFFFLVTYF